MQKQLKEPLMNKPKVGKEVLSGVSHTHEFVTLKSGIRRCYCGAWRNKEGAEAIVGKAI